MGIDIGETGRVTPSFLAWRTVWMVVLFIQFRVAEGGERLMSIERIISVWAVTHSQSLESPRGDIQMFVSRCWAAHNARKGQNYRLLVLPGL